MKLSEAFLEFIEPLVEIFGNPKPRTLKHDAACAMGHVVWNAVAMEKLNPGKNYLTPAKKKGGFQLAAIDEIIDTMAKRKRTLFPDDTRIIGVYDIKKKADGSFSLWAQIVEPKDMN